MAGRYWAYYKSADFAAIDSDRTVAVLPTAAIEQHGPHLPVGVDTMINEGLLGALMPQIPDDLDVRILPIQAVGKSNEHLYATGTLTIPAELTINLWVEIGLSVARAGVRKMVIINSHGGNLDVISIVARELRVRADMFVVKTQWSAFGHPDGLYTADELKYGIHGGDVETSLMLHFQPDLVDMSRAENFHSTAQDLRQGEVIMPTGPISYGWIASDLSDAGTVGNAHIATPEKGALTAAHQTARMVELLKETAERQWHP
ncbi:MAG: creatininase family protein [Pseudomonadota bacterium]